MRFIILSFIVFRLSFIFFQLIYIYIYDLIYLYKTNIMDVIKSRYGKDRSIEKLGDRRIRVMGESEVTKVRKGKSGEISMFDFEGGPCYNLGGTIKHQKTTWKIKEIIVEEKKYEGLTSIILKVDF